MKKWIALILALVMALGSAGCAGTQTAAVPEPTPEAELTGAAAVGQYYTRKAETDTEHDYSHMDLTALEGMASGDTGRAIDTPELSVDVAGALFSANTAEIILRVTANTLESLLYDNGIEPLKNYRFSDETAMLGMVTLKNRFNSISHEYSYCDSNTALASNQLELHYWIATPEPIEPGTFTIPLGDFGYYADGTEFVPLYQGPWNVEIGFAPSDGDGRQVSVRKDVMAGSCHFAVDEIRVTPLACSFRLVCTDSEAYTNSHMDEIVDACYRGMETAAVTLSDGTVLDGAQLSLGSSGIKAYPVTLYWSLSFCCPLDPDAVRSLSLFGDTVDFAE